MLYEDTFCLIFDRVIEEVGHITPHRGCARSYIERLKSAQDDIYNDYKAIRKSIREDCMNFKDPRWKLDRHKCAASFMVAYMNKFKDNEQNLSQEVVAILIGQLILTIFIQEENRKNKNDGILKFLSKNGFQYPVQIQDDNDYLYNWALSIHYGRLSGHLSVLSLSNELFWLERYNRDCTGGA